MKCFYHPQIEAIARCKSCRKGLCKDCAIDVGNGIACKNRCECEVVAINEFLELMKTAYQKNAISASQTAILLSLAGSAFFLLGMMEISSDPVLGLAGIATGILLLFLAANSHYTGRKFLQK